MISCRCFSTRKLFVMLFWKVNTWRVFIIDCHPSKVFNYKVSSLFKHVCRLAISRGCHNNMNCHQNGLLRNMVRVVFVIERVWSLTSNRQPFTVVSSNPTWFQTNFTYVEAARIANKRSVIVPRCPPTVKPGKIFNWPWLLIRR